MKLDKIKFAQLIGYISTLLHNPKLSAEDVDYIDRMIDIHIEPVSVPTNYVEPSRIDELLEHMAGGTKKIEAIKAYRSLTGLGLKESKDIVEKYWPYISETTHGEPWATKRGMLD